MTTEEKINNNEIKEEIVNTEKQNDTPKESKGDKKIEEKKDVDKNSTKSSEKSENNKKSFKKRFGGRRKPFRREKPEFEQRIVSFRRVTRVMAGGRRFSFSVAMVIGNKKGVAGFGLGKAKDTALAIEKAFRAAKKNLVRIKVNDDYSVLYDVEGKYKASRVSIRPVKGKGLAAGGAVRVFLELAGINETGAKILSRSKNNINNIKATMEALKPFSKKYIHIEKKKFSSRNNRRGGRRPFNNNKKSFVKADFNKNKETNAVNSSAKNTPVTEEVKKVSDKS